MCITLQNSKENPLDTSLLKVIGLAKLTNLTSQKFLRLVVRARSTEERGPYHVETVQEVYRHGGWSVGCHVRRGLVARSKERLKNDRHQSGHVLTGRAAISAMDKLLTVGQLSKQREGRSENGSRLEVLRWNVYLLRDLCPDVPKDGQVTHEGGFDDVGQRRYERLLGLYDITNDRPTENIMNGRIWCNPPPPPFHGNCCRYRLQLEN